MTLTKTKPNGSWSVIGVDGKIVPWKDIPKELVGAIYKLHAYEKTGLSPDTIENLIFENKWLCDEIKKLNRLVDELQNILDGERGQAMKGKPLTAETVHKIEEMLARGVKVSAIIEALDVCQKTVYDVRSGKAQKRLKEKKQKQTAKKAIYHNEPICSKRECFACVSECGKSWCIALENTDFGTAKCPFFKTRERMDFEERKTNLRLEELGMRGAVYE